LIFVSLSKGTVIFPSKVGAACPVMGVGVIQGGYDGQRCITAMAFTAHRSLDNSILW